MLNGLAAVDFTEIFDARLEHRMDEQPRLPGRLDRRLTAGVVSGRLLDQQVCPVQQAELANSAKFRFDERPEGKLGGGLVAALVGVLDLNEETEVGEILALRRQLDGAFDGRRVILQVMATWRLQIAFDSELQP